MWGLNSLFKLWPYRVLDGRTNRHHLLIKTKERAVQRVSDYFTIRIGEASTLAMNIKNVSGSNAWYRAWAAKGIAGIMPQQNAFFGVWNPNVWPHADSQPDTQLKPRFLIISLTTIPSVCTRRWVIKLLWNMRKNYFEKWLNFMSVFTWPLHLLLTARWLKAARMIILLLKLKYVTAQKPNWWQS